MMERGLLLSIAVACAASPALGFHLSLTKSHINAASPRLESRLCMTGHTALRCSIDAAEKRNPLLSRRGLGTLLAGFVVGQSLLQQQKAEALAMDGTLAIWQADAKDNFKNYTSSASGLRYKDVKIGVGVPPKKGDLVHFEFAAYLLDGTLASAYAGVEQTQVTLGAGEIPAGLDAGLTGMQVGGRRILVIPPEMGWTPAFRASAGISMRPCDAQRCPLDSQPVVAVVSLAGYRRAECAAVGDIPISADVSQLQQGRVVFNIGSDVCPEGDSEVTESVERAKALIQRLKGEGRLQPEPPRPKTWLDQ